MLCAYTRWVYQLSHLHLNLHDLVLEQLKKRFKRIIILFDRDEAGVKYLRKMSQKTGLEGMLIHKKFKAKDISDAIKANGFDKVKNWLTKNINK